MVILAAYGNTCEAAQHRNLPHVRQSIGDGALEDLLDCLV